MPRAQFSIGELLLMPAFAALALALLIPFCTGKFPPALSSVLLSVVAFFLAGTAIGVPFRAKLIGGLLAVLLYPFLIVPVIVLFGR